MEFIYSIESTGFGSHRDSLMLVSATSTQNAIERAIEETTILDNFEEKNLISVCLNITPSVANYIHIFADDVEYLP